MLVIEIKGNELWDERTEQFVYDRPSLTLHLEHSLHAIAEWEAKHQIPFLGSNLTDDQIRDYITFMAEEPITIEDVNRLSTKQYQQIANYMNDKMSATWFSDRNDKHNPNNGEVVTSELIYYWMAASQIPFSCDRWHFNRLMTLIRICSIKNQPPKKMSKSATMAQNNALNKARRARLKSKG